MPYTAEIGAANPTCFLLLVDQSGSMEKPFRGTNKRKADGVADAVNRLLQTLVLRCSSGATVIDRYYVGVIGYNNVVGSAWGGELKNQDLAPISLVAKHPVRIDTRTKKVSDGAGGLVEQSAKFPVWFDPQAQGQTHMCEALRLARDVVKDFIQNCPNCHPPIVFNITDGMASDGTADVVESCAKELRSVASSDGQVLLFNLHVSSENVQPIEFPGAEGQLADPYARLLFRMSSDLPEAMLRQARMEELTMAEKARGFVFNGNLESVVQLLDIGTRVGRN